MGTAHLYYLLIQVRNSLSELTVVMHIALMLEETTEL